MNMQPRSVVALVVLILALALLAPALAFAGPVGSFTKVEGKVDILRLNETTPLPVQVGDAVSLGDAIRTKRNGKAEIQFKDETVIQLAPETRITIDEYSFRNENTREKGLIGLLRGKIRAIVSKVKGVVAPVSAGGSSFSVKTPTAIAGVKGTIFFIYHERGVTGVIFTDGEGFLYNPHKPGRVVTVKAGQASFVMSGDEPPLDARPVPDSFVDPHLKDMPGHSPVTLYAPDGTAGERTLPIDVVQTNSTYGALTGVFMGNGPDLAGSGFHGTGPLVIGDPGGPVAGPPGGVTTLVPITQTHPELLPTPVNVNVTIP